MAASTINRSAFTNGTTPWNASTINSSIYDKIDELFGGVGTYATLELGGALKVTGALTPVSNNTPALGSSSLMWADLFLGDGGFISFNNGDVLITHSTNTLAFSGASTAYTFADGPVRPATNDGAALGVSGTAWSDLFLASGGVINFASGDVTITHSTDTLTFGGAASGYVFTDGPIINALGAAGTPSYTFSGDLNTGIWSSAADTLNFSTNGTERMRIDSTGRVLIAGTTAGLSNNAATRLTVGGTAATNYVSLLSSGGEEIILGASASTAFIGTFSSTDLQIRTGNTERFRILNGGNVAIGATSRFYFDGVAGTGDTYIYEANANELRLVVGGNAHTQFDATGQYVYYNPPTTASAANAYIAQSAYIQRSTSSIRYKHDVATLDTADALDAVMAMRPITYRGKTDEDQRRFVGFIAEEMQEIAPLLCTYDEGGESGTPNYVTYDRVTAYLVAVVQRQQTEINALKARIH